MLNEQDSIEFRFTDLRFLNRSNLSKFDWPLNCNKLKLIVRGDHMTPRLNTRTLLAFTFVSFATLSSLYADQTIPQSIWQVEENVAEVDTSVEPWTEIDSDDLDKIYRANANHFWYWLANKAKSDFEKQMIQFTGLAVGDAHINNFSDIELANGGRRVGLLDLDDGGDQIPFIYDFLRFTTWNSLSVYETEQTEIWQYYLKGLQGEKIELDEEILRVYDAEHENFLLRQNSYLENNTKNLTKFNKHSEVVPIAETDLITQKRGQIVYNFVTKNLPDREILDFGYRVKTKSGGSLGVPRFWFLTKDSDGTVRILDFKMVKMPATEYYQAQDEDIQRLLKLSNVYRPNEPLYGYFKIAKLGGEVYIIQDKLKGLIDFDPGSANNNEINFGKKIVLYYAYLLGFWHAQQENGELYAQSLRQANVATATYNVIQKLKEEYVAIIEEK